MGCEKTDMFFESLWVSVNMYGRGRIERKVFSEKKYGFVIDQVASQIL